MLQVNVLVRLDIICHMCVVSNCSLRSMADGPKMVSAGGFLIRSSRHRLRLLAAVVWFACVKAVEVCCGVVTQFKWLWAFTPRLQEFCNNDNDRNVLSSCSARMKLLTNSAAIL